MQVQKISMNQMGISQNKTNSKNKNEVNFGELLEFSHASVNLMDNFSRHTGWGPVKEL